MNKNREDIVKQAWKQAPPPPVSAQEWEAVWDRVVGTLPLPSAPRPRRAWLPALGYAVVFLAGVGVGVWGAFLAGPAVGPSPSSVEQPAVIEGDKGMSDRGGPALATLSGPSVSEGIDIEMLGLQDVKVETVEGATPGIKQYRMTAVTPRGVKVVWNYPAEEPETSSSNGGQS